ncbi:MAG: hypothetical protein L6Q95_19125 [Planctomycetes bacterium]|nr:hypothetical protein [Planctomycetota bacterium]
MDEKKAEPSVFRGALAGYGILTAVGVVVAIVLAAGAGQYKAEPSFTVLVCSGALGAILGYSLTVRRRRAMGLEGPQDKWAAFVTSPPGVRMLLIVLGGSFLLTLLILVAYRGLTGKGG